jgi:uncharacterized protein
MRDFPKAYGKRRTRMTTNPNLQTERVLLLPGWLDSGPGHWQTVWELRHGDQRVQQADWQWPLRGDWMSRLEEVLLDDPRPAVLAAHSLGCHLVAAWAAHTRHPDRVLGALLVAPPDLDQGDTPPQLHGWRPVVRQRLPFTATLVYSENDPFCTPQASLALADDWGARAHPIGLRGHVNGESELANWPEGRCLLEALARARSQAV